MARNPPLSFSPCIMTSLPVPVSRPASWFVLKTGRILFIGARTRLGRSFFEYLLREHPEFTYTSDASEVLPSGVQVEEGALTDPAELQKLASSQDIVINCAGDRPQMIPAIMDGLQQRRPWKLGDRRRIYLQLTRSSACRSHSEPFFHLDVSCS